MIRISFIFPLIISVSLHGNSFNVRNFGAQGDGVTDDSGPINQAIVAARASTPGSIVYFPAGRYLYSQTLTFDGISAIGELTATAILIASDSNNSALTLTGSNCAISNLTVTTRTAPTVRNTQPMAAGINVYRAAGFSISNIAVSKVASAGILVRQSAGIPGTYAQIQNCELSGVLADGIHITEASARISIHDNYVHDTGDDFIGIVSYRTSGAVCADLLIFGNTGENQSNGRGIALVGARLVKIQGNRLLSTAGSGIYLASEQSYDTYGVDSVTVADNLIKNCPKAAAPGHAGIRLLGRTSPGGSADSSLWVKNVVTTDNRIMNSSTQGVLVGTCTAGIALTRNIIVASANDGVMLANGAADVSCLGNTISQTGQSGISIQPNVAKVVVGADPETGNGNTIYATGLYGIFIDATNSAATIDILDNFIDSVNRQGTAYVDVINVSGIARGAQISIRNNRYFNSAGGSVERLIESISTPLKAASGNASTITLKSLYSL